MSTVLPSVDGAESDSDLPRELFLSDIAGCANTPDEGGDVGGRDHAPSRPAGVTHRYHIEPAIRAKSTSKWLRALRVGQRARCNRVPLSAGTPFGRPSNRGAAAPAAPDLICSLRWVSVIARLIAPRRA